jgi:hypothetical protein
MLVPEHVRRLTALQRHAGAGIANVARVDVAGPGILRPRTLPGRQDRVTHLARLDGLRCQEPFPGLGQPAVTGHLRPQTCSARQRRSATAGTARPAGGGIAAGGAPPSSSRARARRSAASRSLAAKTFIVSPVPHPQPSGQGSGPAACNGHRQPQPDARHCERHDHGRGSGQASGCALLR